MICHIIKIVGLRMRDVLHLDVQEQYLMVAIIKALIRLHRAWTFLVKLLMLFSVQIVERRTETLLDFV